MSLELTNYNQRKHRFKSFLYIWRIALSLYTGTAGEKTGSIGPLPLCSVFHLHWSDLETRKLETADEQAHSNNAIGTPSGGSEMEIQLII